jgi:hypothetical protein
LFWPSIHRRDDVGLGHKGIFAQQGGVCANWKSQQFQGQETWLSSVRERLLIFHAIWCQLKYLLKIGGFAKNAPLNNLQIPCIFACSGEALSPQVTCPERLEAVTDCWCFMRFFFDIPVPFHLFWYFYLETN